MSLDAISRLLIDHWEQLPLLSLSLLSGWCITSNEFAVRRMGPIFGLLCQPLNIYATVKADGQFGMLILSIIYTFIWARGVYNVWWLPRKQGIMSHVQTGESREQLRQNPQSV